MTSSVQSNKIKGTFFLQAANHTEIFGCSWGYNKQFDGCAAAESQISLEDWSKGTIKDPKITRTALEWTDSGSVFIGNAIKIKAKRQGSNFIPMKMFYRLVHNETSDQTKIIDL